MVVVPFEFIEPCLPVAALRPPKGEAWRHEIKFDGWRGQLHKKGFYDLRFLGLLGDGTSIRAKVTGDADPGYGSTSKMLGQVAACLARHDKGEGGFWTPQPSLATR